MQFMTWSVMAGGDENAFVDWLRGAAARDDASVVQGGGPDDCAHLRACGRRLAATTDTLLEGVHFAFDAPPRAVGYKAVAVNLSDLAASGCRPRWLLAAVGLRRRGDGGRWARELAKGMLACADRHGVFLVGGDTTGGDGPASVAVTALGEPMPGGPVLRSGARPGDVLAVTGSLGGSLAGRHLRPVPRLAEMEALLRIAGRGLRAAMDISDGLAMDLPRLAKESGVGAELDAGAIPISSAARRLARADLVAPDGPDGIDGIDGPDGKKSGPVAVASRALERALRDGEDFELLLAFSPRAWKRTQSAWEALRREGGNRLAPLTAIGRATAHPGECFFKNARGEPLPLSGGYEHRL